MTPGKLLLYLAAGFALASSLANAREAGNSPWPALIGLGLLALSFILESDRGRRIR